MKLPKNYVPGSGVVKATAYGGIGQRLLEKQGWQKGQGLGREKHGMTEALEVKEKKDTLGVGATGVWNWGHKFWEDAYNSVAQNINHEAAASSSSSSDSDSSSSDEDDAPVRARDRRPQRQHRDGTLASSASASELAIAAELAKDPWGRWGGKAGKMARIRQQEELEAQRAREKLGLSQTGATSTTAAAPASGANGTAAPATAPAPAKRIVVTLKIKDDPELAAKRSTFVRTPATGWWGASYFVSVGALEGMEEAREHVAQQRQTFNEDDQANVWMKAFESQRVGHKGLGKSTTVNVAGGKWEGTKKTFADEEEPGHGPQQVAGEPVTAAAGGQQGPGSPAAPADAEVQAGSDTKKQKKKRKKQDEEKAGTVAEAADEAGQAPKSSKKRRKHSSSSCEAEQPAEEALATQPAVSQHTEEPADPVPSRPLKWLKVARVLLKQAPKRRLRLEELCQRMLQESQKAECTGLKRTMSHEKLTSLLRKKAKKSKVVIQDGFVSLPA